MWSVSTYRYLSRRYADLAQLLVVRMTAENRRGLFAQEISVPVALRSLDQKSDIPLRAPAPPRLPPKLPPRPRGAPRKDILALTIFLWVENLFHFSLSVPCILLPSR